MLLILISATLSFLMPDPQTPNFYPGLTTAREASKKSQKEMIIFFSDKTCSPCEAAWVPFTEDAKATSQYVSTRMDVGDFDGGIFFDLLDLKEVPSWVILNPDGTEKERWEGGWKNAEGHHAGIDKEITMPAPATKNEKSIPHPNANTSTQFVHNPPLKNVDAESRYYLQAGYFGSETNAEKLISELKNKGFIDFKILKEAKDGNHFYRVVSNIFPTETEALAQQQHLDAKSVKTSVKSVK